MTRKDYELIAKAISDNRCRYATSDHDDGQNYVLDELTETLCRDFSEENPRFDSNKFRKACR